MSLKQLEINSFFLLLFFPRLNRFDHITNWLNNFAFLLQIPPPAARLTVKRRSQQAEPQQKGTLASRLSGKVDNRKKSPFVEMDDSDVVDDDEDVTVDKTKVP